MAGEERDAKLILRAEDRASRTFDQVSSSVRKLRQNISDQAKAAAEGTADIGALRAQLDELKKAGDDLVRAQSLIKNFEATQAAARKAQDALDKAARSLDEYRAKAGENPTDNQLAQIEKRTTRVTDAQRKLEIQQGRVADAAERLGRAGLTTNNLSEQFTNIGRAAQETASAIGAVKSQIDGLPAAAQRAAAATAELRAATEFGQRNTAGVTPSQFEYIQSLDTARAKLQALNEAEQLNQRNARAAAVAEKERRAQQKRDLEALEPINKRIAESLARLGEEEKRLKDLTAFRALGTAAAEDAAKVDRYAASVQRLGNDFRSFAAEVRQSMGGTATGMQDLSAAIAQVEATAAVLERPKARMNELQETSGRLSIAIATLDRTARQIDGFRLQQQAVQRAEVAFHEAQAEVNRLARAVGEADAPTKQLADDLRQAQRALANAGIAMQNDRNDLVRLSDALKRAGVDTDNLEHEMDQLRGSANRAGDAAGQLQSRLRGRNGFLGLNAYEMQNLSYQVNDVFTQLGSGTPIFQIIAQQGGQITQLFQGLATTLLKLAPIVAVVLLALSPLIGAAIQARREIVALRQAQTLLAGTGEQDGGAVAQYAAAAVQMQNLGIAAKEAKSALEEFHKNGLNPALLSSYASALADANRAGRDVSDTGKLLSEAMSGGAKEIENLNDAFRILTPAEEEHVVQMIADGRESEARRIIYEKFEQTAQRMADSAKGSWSDAWYGLTTAFNNFTNALKDTSGARVANEWLGGLQETIDHTKRSMQELAFLFNYTSKRGVFGTLKDVTFGVGTPNAEQIAAARFARNRGRDPRTGGVPGTNNRQTLEGTRAIRRQTEALDEQRRSLGQLSRVEVARLARQKAIREAGAGINAAERERIGQLAEQRALLQFDDQAQKKAEAQAKRDAAKNKREAKAAETLANQRRAIEQQLERDLATINGKVAEGQLQSLEQRRKAVEESYTGLFQKLEEARRKGVTQVDGQSLAEYEKQVRSQIVILQNAAEMKGREEQINQTIAERSDAIKTIQDQLARGDITPRAAMQAFSETISGFQPRVSQMAADALAFARSLRGAVPDPRLEATISKLERIGQENSAGQGNVLQRKLNTDVVNGQGQRLDQMIQERTALVTAENALVELGVRTRREAQTNIEAAYARTNPLIARQIEQMRELLSVFADDAQMRTFYDTWIAKLKGVEQQTTYVDARYTQFKQGLDQLLTGSIIEGINAIASEFAKLGATIFKSGQNVWETLENIGLALAGLFANLLIGIAQLILQMLILDAIQKITGIPVKALLGLQNVVAGGHHNGGLAGTTDRTFSRSVPAVVFAGAPRYHGGGLAGFAPDEVPAVLQRNEEILTEADPRHRFNLGKGSGQSDAGDSNGIRQVLVLDPEELAGALAGPSGEKVVMTHIRRNKTTIKQALGK